MRKSLPEQIQAIAQSNMARQLLLMLQVHRSDNSKAVAQGAESVESVVLVSTSYIKEKLARQNPRVLYATFEELPMIRGVHNMPLVLDSNILELVVQEAAVNQSYLSVLGDVVTLLEEHAATMGDVLSKNDDVVLRRQRDEILQKIEELERNLRQR